MTLNSRKLLIIAGANFIALFTSVSVNAVSNETNPIDETRSHVKDCISQVEQDVTVEVDHSDNFNCLSDEGSSVPLPTKYKLSMKGGKLTLHSKLYFIWKKNRVNYRGWKTKAEGFKVLDESKQCFVDYFSKYGITLDIEFLRGGITKWYQSDHSIYLKNTAFADSETWPINTFGAQSLRNPDKRCAIHLHEFLHLLGLRDTYPALDNNGDNVCPKRPRTPLNDIMNRANRTNLDFLFIYPDAMKSILSPICNY